MKAEARWSVTVSRRCGPTLWRKPSLPQWLDRFSRRDPRRETVELAGACHAEDGGSSPIRPFYLMSLFSGCRDNRDKRDKRDKRHNG